jgi:hypothetical protein
MMESMMLLGLERIIEVCQRLKLSLEVLPPAREPLKAGDLLEGLPFDSVLATVYARLGYASFGPGVMGWGLLQSGDGMHELKKRNKGWRERWWEELGEPMIVFGCDLYTYAAVPRLADERGRQPVVQVDTYEEPYILPVASNVDRFFDTYSRYLEAVVADPDYQQTGDSDLLFPWDATEILARDERLVELMRAGCFDSLVKNLDDVTRRWAAKVMGTAS